MCTKEKDCKIDWVIIFSLIAIGLILRWFDLDVRPLHHDESLHAIYGKYFHDNPSWGFYKYSPILHGPLLYNLLPYVYEVLGQTKFAARFLSAFLGSLFLFAPLLFRAYLNRISLITLTGLLALAPAFTYWARFIRHDFFVILCLLIMLYGYFCAPSKYKSYFIVIALALQATAMENIYITLVLLLGYLIFEFSFCRLTSLKKGPTLVQELHANIREYPFSLVWATMIAIFIYVYFYTAGFRWSEGIWHGVFPDGLTYWVGQHSIERIAGPFSFQFLILTFYEPVFMCLLATHMLYFYRRKGKKFCIPFLVAVMMAVLLHLATRGQDIATIPMWNFFKLKIFLDFYILFIVPIHAVLVTIAHLLEEKKHLAFFGYFFFASFFTFSYAGEKVPWLSMYIFVPGCIYLILFFQDLDLQLPLGDLALAGILAGFFLLRINIMTNFTFSGKTNELIGQVHTSSVYENALFKIKDQIINPFDRPVVSLFADGENTWPTSWYFFGMKEFSYIRDSRKLNEFDYVLSKAGNAEFDTALLATHHKISIPLRHWWVPEYRDMTWKNFALYLLAHKPWNSPGQMDVVLYTRKFKVVE